MACQARKGLLEHQVKEMCSRNVIAGEMHTLLHYESTVSHKIPLFHPLLALIMTWRKTSGYWMCVNKFFFNASKNRRQPVELKRLFWWWFSLNSWRTVSLLENEWNEIIKLFLMDVWFEQGSTKCLLWIGLSKEMFLYCFLEPSILWSSRKGFVWFVSRFCF